MKSTKKYAEEQRKKAEAQRKANIEKSLAFYRSLTGRWALLACPHREHNDEMWWARIDGADVFPDLNGRDAVYIKVGANHRPISWIEFIER